MDAIAEDFSQYRRVARRGRRIAKCARIAAPPPRSGWACAITCSGATTGRDSNSSRRATAARWPTFIWPRPTSPGSNTTRRSPAMRPPARPATTRRLRARAGPKPSATAGDATAALAVARFAFRRRRADGRISVSARRHGGGAGRQSQRSRGAVRAGRRGRPQSCRRTVRPGHGKRSPRQRRNRHGTLQAGRSASFPRTSARC